MTSPLIRLQNPAWCDPWSRHPAGLQDQDQDPDPEQTPDLPGSARSRGPGPGLRPGPTWLSSVSRTRTRTRTYLVELVLRRPPQPGVDGPLQRRDDTVRVHGWRLESALKTPNTADDKGPIRRVLDVDGLSILALPRCTGGRWTESKAN